MATLSTVRLNKSDSPNWGFRLQGGKDFGTPLVIQKNELKILHKLYVEYKKNPQICAKDFLSKDNKEQQLQNEEIDLFFSLSKHLKFLQTLVEHFLQSISPKDRKKADFILFLTIFVLDSTNWDIILESCLQLKVYYLCDLLSYLVDSTEHLVICQIACKFFDDIYVLEHIIDPLLNKIPDIIKVGKEFLRTHEIPQSRTTKPHCFSFMRDDFYRNFKHPYPPANTPAIKRKFKAASLPNTTWKEDEVFEKKLRKLKQENRKKAEKLMLEAAKMRDDLIKPKKIVLNVCDDDERKIEEGLFKPKPSPVFKPVNVKGNLTSTLREASRIVKVQDEEMQKIDSLVKGGFNEDDFKALEMELRKEKEMQEYELIEKNHLKGLLSHEEAQLAKQKLQEATKQKMEIFKENRLELLKALDEWKEQEEQKIRSLVTKSQLIKQNAKESEKKMLEIKQHKVRMQQQEIKQMLESAMEERSKELSKKIELIKEIKAMHQVQCNIKEFDPTETPNLGLLCEMSIAELQERLVLTKMEMKRELEEKRCKILRKKENHKTMIENIKKLIQNNSNAAVPKKNSLKKSSKTELKNQVQESYEVAELKRKLEEKKRLRNNKI